MSKLLTAFETLADLTPKILAWQEDARFVLFILNDEPDAVPLDGKDSRWCVAVYSQSSDKTCYFRLDKQFAPTTVISIKWGRDQYLELDKVKSYNLLDSDWATQQVLQLGLPLNEHGQIKATISGGINWSTHQKSWNFGYIKEIGQSKEVWGLNLDMETGATLSHHFSFTLH